MLMPCIRSICPKILIIQFSSKSDSFRDAFEFDAEKLPAQSYHWMCLGINAPRSRVCNMYELLCVAENLLSHYCDESANKLLSNEGLVELRAVAIPWVSRL